MALLLLVRRRNEAVSSGLKSGRSLDSIAGRIEAGQRRAIADARQLSRLAGFSRLRAEAASVGFELGRAGAIATDEVARDMYRARRAAQSFAKRWLRHAEGETAREAANAATRATAGSLRRIGVTESSEAFNTGRAKYVRSIRETKLFKIWDATLDKRTCPICSRASGTIVGIRENFPQGEPGALHPFDRCTFALLTSAESTDDSLILQAA